MEQLIRAYAVISLNLKGTKHHHFMGFQVFLEVFYNDGKALTKNIDTRKADS